MATRARRNAARKNIERAAAAARRKKTISRLPKKTRTALGKQGSKAARKRRKRR
jgi:ABC-type transport system involved in Fe-S cluster assembly fused permease/ATPase subunit